MGKSVTVLEMDMRMIRVKETNGRPGRGSGGKAGKKHGVLMLACTVFLLNLEN